MRYTRKDVSELLEQVNGGPDVAGFATSNFSSTTYTLVASGPGTVWQDLYNSAHRVCSEDGATSPYEDCSGGRS
ncbi:hypothetical protein D7V97_01160 [Corallococcus sp. CA053C]|uniref:hypothetical protein n=1 Tax=Corallococcus sp. CA053C TaxID=2316732 RepID=UPI000EA24AD8|nr:hypothetical protein [Corallococcus sp. CA053C]RKH15058.1 hypothetical protein D7V97_01160 [Corallococcus sp. CA053C]